MERHAISYHIYADDTQMYTYFNPKDANSISMAVCKIEACIRDVRSWMTANQLKLNDEKTEFIVITSPSSSDHVKRFHPSVVVGDKVILPSVKVKTLGVILDSNMSMAHHVNKVVKSAYFHLRSISKIRHYLNDDTCAKLMVSLVLSQLDYANSLLAGIPDSTLRKLQLVQNRAARIVSKSPRRAHITPILQNLHWLPVVYRIKFKVLCFIFKCLIGNAPHYLIDLVSLYCPSRSLRSASANLLTVPRVNKRFGERMFAYAGPVLWNALPYHVKGSPNINSFKKSVKTLFFRSAFNLGN